MENVSREFEFKNLEDQHKNVFTNKRNKINELISAFDAKNNEKINALSEEVNELEKEMTFGLDDLLVLKWGTTQSAGVNLMQRLFNRKGRCNFRFHKVVSKRDERRKGWTDPSQGARLK